MPSPLRTLRCLPVCALALVGLFAVPTASAAAVAHLPATGAATAPSAVSTLDSATIFGQPGGGLLDGRPQVFSSATERFVVLGDAGSVELHVQDPREAAGSREADLTFSAPRGQTLAVGAYEGTMDDFFREPGRPGMYLSADGRGCGGPGRFEVLDIAVTEGKISRLHLLYEIACRSSSLPTFGEVRIGVDRPDGPLLVTSGIVAFPRTMPGASSPLARVTVANDSISAATPGAPRVEGPDAAAFTVVGHTCGDAVPAGSACTADVRFVSARVGQHAATLTFPGAPEQPVALDGAGDTGRTSWRMASQPDEPILNGSSVAYADHEAVVEAHGAPNDVQLAVYALPYDFAYSARFTTSDGSPLQAGRTYTYDTTPGAVSTAEMFVRDRSAWSLRRGQFTVHEAETAYGQERLSISFEQEYRDRPGVLRGTLEYRATTSPSAIWFTDIGGTTHADAIGLLTRAGHVDGYDDGTYRPDLPVSRGQLATQLARSLMLPFAGDVSFRDISDSVHWRGIISVANAGIATGYGDGTFRPGASLTRGQAATFLVRAFDLPDAPPGRFTDTARDAHASDIDALAAAGITSGYGNGTFRPGDTVTRAQLAGMLARALDLQR